MRVCLGVPVVGSVPGYAYHNHLSVAIDVATVAMGERGEVIIPGVLDIHPHGKARQAILDEAIKFDCDLLYFVDSDMIVPPKAFGTLLGTLQRGAVMSVGHAYRRGYPYTPTWFKARDGKTWSVDAKSGEHEIDSCGLACNVIDLGWLRQFPEEKWFLQGTLDGKEFYEDAWFCERVRAHGGKVIGNADVRCGHIGLPIVINDASAEALRKAHLRVRKELDNGTWRQSDLSEGAPEGVRGAHEEHGERIRRRASSNSETPTESPVAPVCED